jgi:hypothetical protein
LTAAEIDPNPDWIGCANGCGWGPDKGRDICMVCVAVEEGRHAFLCVKSLAKAEQLELFQETGT